MVRWMGFDSELQKKVEYRAGDTIISVPQKSGSTWTTNIVHQLRTGGDEDFKDICSEIPWLELRERPNQPDEELLERWSALQHPRCFKTHSFPGDSPGACVSYRENLKYIVVFRNPDEAIVSLQSFFEKMSIKNWELWGALSQREKFIHPDFPTFFEKCVINGMPHMPPEMVPPGGVITMFYLSFINGWWPLRNKPNVLMLHFNDMKSEHELTVRKIAKFLGIDLTKEKFSKVIEYTSFRWMKKNQSKFEMQNVIEFPVLQEGGMIRKGEAGKAMEDGMTPEISATIRSFAEQFVKDKQALEWMYKGGALSPDENPRSGFWGDLL